MSYPDGSVAALVYVMKAMQQVIDDFFGDGNCEFMISLMNTPEPGFLIAPHGGGTLLSTDGLNEPFEVSIGVIDPTLASLLAGSLNTAREKMNIRL